MHDKLFKKKWILFKKKKLAYYSLIILLITFTFSLLANIYASPKPYIVKYNGQYYFPFFKVYPETTFGGAFETEADYRDSFFKEGLAENEDNFAIYPPVAWDYKSINSDYTLQHPSPPSKTNWLGTDNRGRDVLARLIYAIRISLFFGIILTIIDLIIGITVGSLQGFFGGKFDLISERIVDIWISIPPLYLLILVASIYSPSIPLLIILLSLHGWISFKALVRLEFLKARNLEYVKAARALGVSNKKIIFKHILPNALTIVITRIPFAITGAMTTLVGLDFLGLGVPMPTPSIGELLKQGQENLEAWWITLPTMLCYTLILVLVTFIGEALLEVLDPRRNP